jgi:glycerate 2-kinase
VNLNHTARELFAGALRGLDIAAAMQHLVMSTPTCLVVDGKLYPAISFRRILIVSIGKAAVPMAEALLTQLQPALTKAQTVEGIVVGASLPERPDERLRFFRGGHPLPDLNSQAAANAILQLLATCDPTCLVFFLISGGASAMVEQPLDSTLTLEDARDLHRALVHSGLPITQMNALRKHFSRVKGGRLAVAAQGAAQCTLLISDVPSDSLHVVGSGPSLPDPATVADCLHLLESNPASNPESNAASLDLSKTLLDFFTSPSLPETPKPDHPAFSLSQHAALLSSDDLCSRAAQAATDIGFHVTIDNTCDDWDYRDAASYLLHRLEELRRHHPRVCLLSAGELSVKITGTPGTGGRNQQFVLECARLLAGMNFPATVLSGGSDGVDGNSTAAGALCDETTVARAAAQGIDIAAALRNFDSAPVFSALGDAIITAPIGNNVRDLRILLSTA